MAIVKLTSKTILYDVKYNTTVTIICSHQQHVTVPQSCHLNIFRYSIEFAIKIQSHNYPRLLPIYVVSPVVWQSSMNCHYTPAVSQQQAVRSRSYMGSPQSWKMTVPLHIHCCTFSLYFDNIRMIQIQTSILTLNSQCYKYYLVEPSHIIYNYILVLKPCVQNIETVVGDYLENWSVDQAVHQILLLVFLAKPIMDEGWNILFV